jgi:ubiquinone/menaquinone biosynthesis C-methylase UbiE
MEYFAGGKKLLDPEIILTKAQVGSGMKIAELGCGANGYFVFPVAQKVGKAGRVYAVDILKTVLESLSRRIKQENTPNVIPVWSNLEIYNATKIEAGSLDIIFLINTLHLSNKRKEIMREAIRMLKKDGRMLIVEWGNIALPFGPPLEERVNAELLKYGAQKLGLKLEEEFTASQFHYGLIFTKI